MLTYASVTLALLAAQVLANTRVPQQLFDPLVAEKVLKTATAFPSPPRYPQYTDRVNGSWKWFSPDQWTTGFFPSTLYAMHERATFCKGGANSGDAAQWLDLGRTWATGEIPLMAQTSVGHDVGFLSFPFADELAVNPKNATAIHAVTSFAAALAARYNPTVGCTRSWDSDDPTDFQVIIDNMMNLEVLFAAAKLTGNRTLKHIAISHANKTMENHIRPDGGTYHVVEYNSTTGDIISRHTSQGYSDDSTWSRGQAWAIYGFANMHKHTNSPAYLHTARRLADYFINNIPSDGIVPWDFNAPLTPSPRPADSSAAMIAVNGLFLLADRERAAHNDAGEQKYSAAAHKILADNTQFAWNPSWQSLLSNGTVNNPAGNNLTGIVYGDYYFVKAGNILLSKGQASCN